MKMALAWGKRGAHVVLVWYNRYQIGLGRIGWSFFGEVLVALVAFSFLSGRKLESCASSTEESRTTTYTFHLIGHREFSFFGGEEF